MATKMCNAPCSVAVATAAALESPLWRSLQANGRMRPHRKMQEARAANQCV